MERDEILKKLFEEEVKNHFLSFAFSEKAKLEGKEKIALVLKAISEADKINALSVLNLSNLVRETHENLKYLEENKNYDVNFLYKDLTEKAESLGDEVLIEKLKKLSSVKKIEDLIIKDLMTSENELEGDVWICEICGNIHIGGKLEECPICGNKESFRRIE